MVIFTACSDAELICPDRDICLIPYFYAHMIRSLTSLADGKIAVILESGCSNQSFNQTISFVTRALLDYPNSTTVDEFKAPSLETCNTILNCIYAHRSYWKCLNIQETYTLEELNHKNYQPDLHKIVPYYMGNHLTKNNLFTMHTYPATSDAAQRPSSGMIKNCKFLNQFKI